MYLFVHSKGADGGNGAPRSCFPALQVQEGARQSASCRRADWLPGMHRLSEISKICSVPDCAQCYGEKSSQEGSWGAGLVGSWQLNMGTRIVGDFSLFFFLIIVFPWQTDCYVMKNEFCLKRRSLWYDGERVGVTSASVPGSPGILTQSLGALGIPVALMA